MTKKCKPIPGWQTMRQAAEKHGVTRQRIHQIVVERKIPQREMLFYKMVPDPFPFHDVKRK